MSNDLPPSTTRTTDVRRGHEVDVGRLKRYLDDYAAADIPGYDRTAALELKQFNAGQSNPTFLLTLSGGGGGGGGGTLRLVLRKRPAAVRVASAHNVAREFKVLRCLGGGTVPVPAVYHMHHAAAHGSADPSGLGVDFYIMAFVDGEVFDDPALQGVPRNLRAAYYLEAARVLARVHAVPLHEDKGAAFGTLAAALGAPPLPSSPGGDGSSGGGYGGGCDAGYFARQIRRLVVVSGTQAEDAPPVEGLGALADRLSAALAPASEDPACLVHGDFKLDNLVWRKGCPEVAAVLDWEMCAAGHPMADLANLTMVFATPRGDPGGPAALRGLGGLDLRAEGLASLSAVAAAYGKARAASTAMLEARETSLAGKAGARAATAARAGEKGEKGAKLAPHPLWESGAFLAFLFFKNAVIAQGVAGRSRAGTASSPFAHVLGKLPPLLVAGAHGLLDAGLSGITGGDDGDDDDGEDDDEDDDEINPVYAVIFDVGGVLTPSPFPAMWAWEKQRGLPRGFASAALGTPPPQLVTSSSSPSSPPPPPSSSLTAAVSASTDTVFAMLERGAALPDDPSALAALAATFNGPEARARFLRLKGKGFAGGGDRPAWGDDGAFPGRGSEPRPGAAGARGPAAADGAAADGAALSLAEMVRRAGVDAAACSELLACLAASTACFAAGGEPACPVEAMAAVVRDAAARGLLVCALTNDMLPPRSPPARSPALAPAAFRVKFNVVTASGPGSFIVKVHEGWAPVGAAHFKKLVAKKHFDDTRFFRVIPSFMVQFGISGDPEVSAIASKDTIMDEPVKQTNKPGYVTFAKTGSPNSRSTQLFINCADNGRLDGMGFAPFGEVEGDGMAVVKAIYNCGEKPQQRRIQGEGNRYLDQAFPNLSKIVSAAIVEDAASAPPPPLPAAPAWAWRWSPSSPGPTSFAAWTWSWSLAPAPPPAHPAVFQQQQQQQQPPPPPPPPPLAAPAAAAPAAFFPWLESLPFRAVVRSSLLGHRKPEPAAFEAALRAVGLGPDLEPLQPDPTLGCSPRGKRKKRKATTKKRVVFVDDLDPNLAAAAALGLEPFKVPLLSPGDHAAHAAVAAALREALGLSSACAQAALQSRKGAANTASRL